MVYNWYELLFYLALSISKQYDVEESVMLIIDLDKRQSLSLKLLLISYSSILT